MLKQVLESIQDMLEKALAEKDQALARQVYIQCANTLLKKTIEGMEPQEKEVQVRPPKKTTPLGQEAIAYEVEASDGKLKRINYPGGKEVEGEKMVALNGVAMEYKDAIGKTFTTGEVL